MSWVCGSGTVGTFNVKMESISIIPLCQLMDLSLVSAHPSQLRVNWMVLMITVINWVTRIIRDGSNLVGQISSNRSMDIIDGGPTCSNLEN